MSTAHPKPTSRVAIIGAGHVGAAAAYALILGSVVSEILLVDVKVDLRDGQVRDLSDASYAGNSGIRVRAATYREASQCDIIVITAGSKYNIGRTKNQLVYRNVSILRSVINAMMPFQPDAIILVVANPVDLLTSLAQELSGLPRCQVLGSGTFLDSVRLRGLLADKAGVAANSIDVYVLGLHGDSQFVSWSTAAIGGVPIGQALPPETFHRNELADECRHKSQRIIEAKGATPFGIGSIVASICSSILLDKRNVRPISHFQPDLGCCLSLPVILGRQGIVRTLPLPLDADEKGSLAEAAKTLSSLMERVKKDMDAHNHLST